MSGRTLRGRLEREDFGGVTWILVTDDGERWQLQGAIDPAWTGRRLTVHGAPAAAQFGFAMVGPVFEVERAEIE